MSFPPFVVDLLRLGLRVGADGGALLCRAPKGVLSYELCERLREEKPVILEALVDREAARSMWSDALKEVAQAWTVLDGECGASRFLEEGGGQRLESELGDAIRTADRHRAANLIEQWRESWLTRLADLQSRGGMGTRETRMDLVPELSARSEARVDAAPEEDLDALERAVDLRNHGELPHPNQSVWDMLAGNARPRSGKEFSPATLERRQWLQRLVRSGAIDNIDPFSLRPAVQVEDPPKMAEALLRDLELPDSTRCRSGVAQRDLEALFQHLSGTTGDLRWCSARTPPPASRTSDSAQRQLTTTQTELRRERCEDHAQNRAR